MSEPNDGRSSIEPFRERIHGEPFREGQHARVVNYSIDGMTSFYPLYKCLDCESGGPFDGPCEKLDPSKGVPPSA